MSQTVHVGAVPRSVLVTTITGMPCSPDAGSPPWRPTAGSLTPSCPTASSRWSSGTARPACWSLRCWPSSQAAGVPLTVYTPGRPRLPRWPVGAVHDTDLAVSYHHDIETVPTLLRVEDGGRWSAPSAGHRTRVGGPHRRSPTSARACPSTRPGCGSLSRRPRHGRRAAPCASAARPAAQPRGSSSAALEDEVEALFDRGWTDGLPVVPPTEARVLRMLEGTTPRPRRGGGRRPARPGRVHGREGGGQRGDGRVPSRSTCRWCWPRSRRPAPTTFNIHGLLATTCFSRARADRERARSAGASA